MITLNFKGFVASLDESRMPRVFIKKTVMCIAVVLLLSQSAFAQAPNISYSPSTDVLPLGTAFSITPANTGGAVQGSYGVTTFAGSTSGTSGTTNGTGTAARFNAPSAIWIDPASGTMYIADQTNNQIRQITSAGVVTLLAGSPTSLQGTTNGTGTAALFGGPVGITGDGAGNLYIAEYANSDIRKIVISTAAVTLLAGSSTGASGLTNGTGTAARFNLPRDIKYNPTDGALYVADFLNNQIRKVTTAGVVTTFAGSNSGTSGLANGTGTAATFNRPDGIAVDASGNLIVSDSFNSEIRKITTPGAVASLFAGSATGASGSTDGTGTAATFNLPAGISVDAAGNLYVADNGNNKIRLISSSAVVTTIAGNGTAGYLDGTGTAAEFKEPRGIYFDPSGVNLYIADWGNNVIRRFGIYGYTISPSLPAGLTFNNTTGTISGTPTTTFSPTVFTVIAYNPTGSSSTTITLSAAGVAPNISYTPSTNVLNVGSAFSITPANSGGAVPLNTIGLISTFAGSTAGTAGRTNATGTAALFDGPRGGAFDASGNVYVADNGNNEIRKITPAGVVTLLAGSSTGASGITNGTGTAALFNFPVSVASDGAGNLYVTDFNNNEIRKIVISTGAVTLLAGSATGASGSANGTGSAATFNGPEGITYNSTTGALYVTEGNGNRIRKVTTAGVVTTFAGSGTAGNTNGTGTTAQFFAPRSIAADASGNLYVADYGNNEIRKITTAAVVSLFAGSATGASGSANGTGSAATFSSPLSVTVDASGNLYIGDGSNLIRAITSAAVVTTVAGTGSIGYVDGAGTLAEFNRMEGIEYNPTNGTVLIGDLFNNVIREMSNYGYFITPSLPAGLSFDGTTGKISGTPTASFSATVFTVTAYNQYGSSTTTITLSCVSKIDWTGTTSTDWATGSNWSTGTVPGVNDMARIGVVAYSGSQPTVSLSTSVYAVELGKLNLPVALTLASGAILSTGTGGVVMDSLAKMNVFGPGILLIGSGTTKIYANSGISLLSNAVLSLGTNVSLINQGTFALASDANGSASIAALPSGASVSGVVLWARYITGGAGHRGYRLLSSPVYASTDSYSNKIYSINFLLNSTFLTGYGGTAGGFSQYGNPTLYLYRESLTNPASNTFYGGNFRSINNISASPNYTIDIDGGPYNIPIGNGYLFFFRGSTSTVNPYTTTTIPVAATLLASGTLNQGTITVKDWFTPSSSSLSFTAASPAGIQGFNLLGNPYPCTINFEKFNRNGASSTIYMSGMTTPATIYFFNPVTKQYCSYQQKSSITSAADTTTSINPGISSDGYASNMIPSGEGFFIKATGTGQTFTFTENAKVTTQPLTTSLGELMSTGNKSLPSAHRSADLAGLANASATQPDALLRLRMVTDSLNTDEVVLVFNSQGAAAYSAQQDALDLGGNGALENLSLLSSDSVKLCIYKTQLPGKIQQIIPLLVDAVASGNYQLKKIQLNNLPKLYHVWLMDAFMKDSLEVTANDTYSFDIDKSNPATFGTGRFTLVIRQDPALGVHLLNFTALKATAGAQVGWVTENEAGYTSFTVERSSNNGTTFIDLGEIASSGLGTYGFLDKNPPVAADQYRLKITDLNGTITYSSVVTLIYGNGKGSQVANTINVYPNPASSVIDLTVAQNDLAPSSTASYKIIITNSSGSIVKTAVSVGATWQSNVSGFLPGTYMIQVVNNNNNSLVGKTKFIKN